MSGSIMLLTDRLILARYSLEAMNACGGAGISSNLFMLGAISIASVSEVFVGQYNGSRQYSKITIPVWQMLWFSMLSALIFWPIAIFGAKIAVPKELHALGVPYFKLIMLFNPLYPMFVALTGFFVGRGFARVILFPVICSNVVNLILNLTLIFGIKGWLAPMGIMGAAIATCASMTTQFVILASIFFNYKHRRLFKTHKPSFNLAVLTKCLRIGFPTSISKMVEMLAWAVLTHIGSSLGVIYLTALSIGSNIFLMFLFLSEGIQKGILAIASNLIGASKIYMLHNLAFNAVKMHFIIMLILAPFFLIYPMPLVKLFINSSDPQLIDSAVATLSFVWMFMLVDGIPWMFASILTAAGDTLYIMYVNSISAWVGGVLPVLIGVYFYNIQPSMMWGLSTFYALINLVFLLYRYFRGNWLKLDIARDQI